MAQLRAREGRQYRVTWQWAWVEEGEEWGHSYNKSTTVIYSVLFNPSARYVSTVILTASALLEEKSRGHGLFI